MNGKDPEEEALLREYNQALDALRKIPKGDPRHIPVSARLIAAQRRLKNYRRSRGNSK